MINDMVIHSTRMVIKIRRELKIINDMVKEHPITRMVIKNLKNWKNGNKFGKGIFRIKGNTEFKGR